MRLPSPALESSDHPLLATAREFAPRLAARSDEIEAARRLPADLAQELAQAGFFRMYIPEAYGGLELHPAQILQVVEALAQGDGSAAWCVMIGASTAMISAWLPESAARAIYPPRETITGGVSAPIGRAEKVEGGYRVSGRWPWASGSQNCQWLMGGALIYQDGKPVMTAAGAPQLRLFVFPAKDVVLHDTWHSSGLCGTGSGDMEVKDLFVSEAFSCSPFDNKPVVPRPLFAFPGFGLLGVGLPGVALGIARRAIDELSALSVQKTLSHSKRLLAQRSSVQLAVAEAEALVRAGRALMLDSIHRAYEAGLRGEVTTRARAELRLAYTFATRSSARAVDLMYEVAGGSSVFRSSPLQRCFRDIHVATQHALVAPVTLETIGAVLLGVDKDAPTL